MKGLRAATNSTAAVMKGDVVEIKQFDFAPLFVVGLFRSPKIETHVGHGSTALGTKRIPLNSRTFQRTASPNCFAEKKMLEGLAANEARKMVLVGVESVAAHGLSEVHW